MRVLLTLTVLVLAIAILFLLFLVALLWRRQGESSNNRFFLKVEAGPHGSSPPSARVTRLEEEQS